MEEDLAGLSTKETEGLIREAGRSLQAVFNGLHRSFDSKYGVSVCVCVCLCARHSLLAELDSKASEVSPEQCDISVLCIFLFVTSSACAHRSILQLERVGVCVSVQKCACVRQGDP